MNNTPNNPPIDPALLNTIATGLGITPDEAHRRLTATPAPPAPTVTDHISNYLATLTANSRRTYATHLKRLSDGIGPVCDQTCPPCMDPTNGYLCACDCRACTTSRLDHPRLADEIVSPVTYSRDHAQRICTIARRLAVKKGRVDNARRQRRGQAPKIADGAGAEETAVAALRSLFATATTWCGPDNPAQQLRKPPRRSRERRPLHDFELLQLRYITATGGNDSELDTLLVDLALATGARREGIHTLTVGQLDHNSQHILLRDKYKTTQPAPVSTELLDRLQHHANERGGPSCDPNNPDFDPNRPVFWYQRAGTYHRVTERRIDHLVARWQRSLQWASDEQVGFHHLRHTIGAIIEARYGRATKRRYLRHHNGDVTDNYGACTLDQLARALSELFAFEHPLVQGVDTRRVDTLRQLGLLDNDTSPNHH